MRANAVIVMAMCTLGAGCLEGAPAGPPSCGDCHGTDGLPGPPAALGGITDPDYPGVGAHAAHDTPDRAVPVPCTECHTVPGQLDDPGHIDTPWPAEVPWGDLAKLGGASVPFDHETMTCTVYCHGTTIAGGNIDAPGWTQGGEVALCVSCHGNPPPDPHPPAPNGCGECHNRDAATQHVDGILQLGGNTCAGCHGEGADDLAPPPDTNGNTDPSLVSVGAHDAHVTGNGRGAPVACSDCHVVPTAVDDPGHIDASPAEVIFGGIAGTGATFDGSTCTNTYCHTAGDAVRTGALYPDPGWGIVAGNEVSCGSCHGTPPPDPHPANIACENCHDTAGPGLTIAKPEQHVNGTVDL